MTLRLKKVTAGYSRFQIASNFRMIEDYINDMVLKRQVTRGEANQMLVNLVLSPTQVGSDVGYVSTEGVDGSGGDLCDIPIFPPVPGATEGVRLSQSVLEILYKPQSHILLSQSVCEVLYKPPSSLRSTQSVLEVIYSGE